jgi:type IV pilus assembly protein PilB
METFDQSGSKLTGTETEDNGQSGYRHDVIVQPPDKGEESTSEQVVDSSTFSPVGDRVASRLLKSGELLPQHVEEAYNEWKRQGEKDLFWRTLARHPAIDRDVVFKEAARIYAFQLADLEEVKPTKEFVEEVLDGVSKEQQDRMFLLRMLPLEYEYDRTRAIRRLIFVTHDPGRAEVIDLVHELKVDQFDLRYAAESAIIPLIETYFPARNEYLERLAESDDAFDLGASFELAETQLVDEEALEAEINRSGLINLFEASLVEAVRMGASDVHIFPRSKQTEFYVRVDGFLQHWHTQDKVHPEAMLAVAKDRCLNIDRFEREAAQDGYIQRSVDDAIIRYRVSVLPIASADRGVKAESIVIRVLDDRKMFTDLAQIGLLEGAMERFNWAIKQPQGMIIMTGPTGSGKSTTLAAALHTVVRPEVNLLTVEDPVEYLIPGVRQIKLGPRLGVESALRSILRHDPDIVMVGEMRDRPTAELAIKLANTGHLTFSTLHTNDAPSAVSRLYKMGIEPFLIAYAINLVVAQRLLRKLCPDCKKVDEDPDTVLLKALGFTEEECESTTFYTASQVDGCPGCNGVGFKGRRAISEALYFSREIRHHIIEAGISIDEDLIKDTAVKEGMLTLLASGREVVKMGETSIEEVIRVTSTDE